MKTAEELMQKLLDEFAKTQQGGAKIDGTPVNYHNWEEYTEDYGDAPTEDFALFCAKKIQDARQEEKSPDWETLKATKQIIESEKKEKEQALAEQAKQIFEEFEQHGLHLFSSEDSKYRYNCLKSKFLGTVKKDKQEFKIRFGLGKGQEAKK